MGKNKSPSPEPRKSDPPRGKKGKAKSESSKLVQMLVRLTSVFVFPVLFGYFGYQMHLKFVVLPAIVNTPSDLPKVLAPDAFAASVDPERYWGSYVANNYFGLRTRDPNSPLVGLMWFHQAQSPQGIQMPNIRHWCDQGDGLKSYGWVQHDGKNFGRQLLEDTRQSIETSFVKVPGGKNGGDWSARVTATSNQPGEEKSVHSFMVYVALAGAGADGSFLKPVLGGPADVQHIEAIKGFTPELGAFSLRINYRKAANVIAKGFLAARFEPQPDHAHLKELMLSGMGVIETQNPGLRQYLSLMGYVPLGKPRPDNPNVLAIQITYLTGTDFDIVFESASNAGRQLELSGDTFDQVLLKHQEAFEKKFEATFGLGEKQYPKAYVDAGHLALSNMLGSIGYFHGSSIVTSQYNPTPVPYGPHQLFTTIPSRPFFPRGFLWDDGFHELLLKRWDPELSLQILSSWLDLMNVEGWIPREMILGPAAEVKVPAEYIVQDNSVANPPMFFFLISKFLDDPKLAEAHKEGLKKLYPRLRKWFSWLNETQAGPKPGTYRWRGRNGTTTRELNPKTLPSGLDDYPRASHPSDAEQHVDLYCWMALSSRTLARLAALVGDSSAALAETAAFLGDPATLDAAHWAGKTSRYADFGLHTKHVKLQKPKPIRGPDGQPRPNPNSDMVRVTLKEPTLRHVSDTFGYISLFPLFLRLIPPDSPKLKAVLEQLKDEDHLWSKFGLRSLGKTSPLYGARNTEHDPPYWRGAIWLNMNYLALSALHHYSQVKGPNRDLAFEIYGDLRGRVVSNVVREYMRTGFLWEHYDDESGKGEGTHPFTGWTSLVLMMMAEQYD